jgi:hypothetical protein
MKAIAENMKIGENEMKMKEAEKPVMKIWRQKSAIS